MANRYGGKGVVSKILPRELMPRKSNGEPIQIIFNEFTMPNRENPGQIFELHQNHVGHGIIEHIKKNNLSLEEAIELVSKKIKRFITKWDIYDTTLSSVISHDYREINRESTKNKSWSAIGLDIIFKDSKFADIFINTPFDVEERHLRRLKMVSDIEAGTFED